MGTRGWLIMGLILWAWVLVGKKMESCCLCQKTVLSRLASELMNMIISSQLQPSSEVPKYAL
jgi:hypothetical protein